MEDLTKQKIRTLKVKFSNGEISCKVYGNGTKNLLAFYGFGQSGNDLISIIQNLHDYTIYVFDLPFHGETKIIDPSNPISRSQVIEFFQTLLNQQEISDFSLMGFSIGAKFVFQFIDEKFKGLNQVVLIAPDGIRENTWYTISTGSKLMRSIFKSLVNKSEWLVSLISIARRLRIIDTKTASFARKTLMVRGRNQQLYSTWCYLRNLKVNINSVAQTLNNGGTKVIFAVGKDDGVIHSKSIVPLTSKLEDYQILELEAEHHNLIRKFSEEMTDHRIGLA